MINKPLTLIVREFDEELINIINNYQLPAHTVITELQKLINIIIVQDEEMIEKYNKEQEVDKDAKDK